ncbi:MAG: glutamine synthetase [Chitinophagales bacterium]|nr:MAG: glutamine synthetase [Chitinophagales bacterium]
MAKVKLEYVWLDGYKPEPNLRSKTKILDLPDFKGELSRVPEWSFDGSSTRQAEGHSSDCLLKPVATYYDAGRENAWLVMCEVLNPDGTPHASNTRAAFEDNEDFWFGFEQEYTLVGENRRPLGFPQNGFPAPQGMYYCSVGHMNVTGREIVEEHLDLCLKAGLNITGINAEVMLGQWEFQCFGKGKRACDDLWIARYLLHRVSEKHGVYVEFFPKPVKGDWNGSGMHCNFSFSELREVGGEQLVKDLMKEFEKYHKEHIAVYGSSNDLRLTGLHETQHIEKFSYGVSDRGASIRIPISMTLNNWKGYLEDRRPASNADPYQVAARIMKTVNSLFKVKV